MNTQIEAMVEQAKALSHEDRLELLDALNELIPPPDAVWQTDWARECDDRLAAYEQGKIEAEDFDVVMAKLRKEFLAQ